MELEISQRILQRWRSDTTPLEDQRPYASRSDPRNKLSEEEIQIIVEMTSQKDFQSLPPSQIVPILADRWIYLGSESSFYRILRKKNMQHHSASGFVLSILDSAQYVNDT